MEAMPLFINLKQKMALLGWVYEGSLRWSINSKMVRVIYKTGKCAVLELWRLEGDNQLLRKINADCNEKGLSSALHTLGITRL